MGIFAQGQVHPHALGLRGEEMEISPEQRFHISMASAVSTGLNSTLAGVAT